MRFLLRALALFIVVMSAISAIRGLMKVLQPAERPRVNPTNAGRLVKDPVCGTYVPEEAGFCSDECRRKFNSQKA